MRPSHFILIIFFFCFFSSHAQTRDNLWFEANLKLRDGTEMSGEANYNLRDQIVQLLADDKVYSFSEFEIETMTLKRGDFQYDFMLTALKNDQDRVELMLVEMICQSPENYSYVKRHTASKKSFLTNGAPIGPTVPLGTGVAVAPIAPSKSDIKANANKDSFRASRNGLSRRGFERWLINYEGEKVKLNKKNLLEKLKDKRREIKAYMKKNHTSLLNDLDVTELLIYYDSIK